MMGKGIRPSFIQDEFGNRNSNGLNGTAAADDILKYLKEEAERSGRDPNKVAIGWITLWSGKCIFQCVTVCNYYYSEYEFSCLFHHAKRFVSGKLDKAKA
jgi:hypothetical protein